MTVDTVIDIARETVWIIVEASAPMLIVSLLVGLIISVFQTVTSIQEQTLTFVPKLLAIMLILIVCGNWMLTKISSFTIDLYTRFGDFIR